MFICPPSAVNLFFVFSFIEKEEEEEKDYNVEKEIQRMSRTKLICTVGLIAVLTALSCPAGAMAVNVKEMGAVGDGKHDDTQAFLDAVAEAKQECMNVFVPKGVYVTSKTIELENVGMFGPEAGAWNADLHDVLPSIIPSHTDTPAFHLGAAGSLKGLDITCHGITDDSGGPPAILISGIGVYIANMRIRYAWDGIITDGEHNVGRPNIENVFMVTIRNVGVRVIGTWDVPRLDNIEVWNTNCGRGRIIREGIGFHLLKNDLIRITDCFAFAMHTGFLLENELEGAKIKGGTWGVMNGCSTDYCGRGIVVKGYNTLSVSGGTLWNHAQSLIVDGEGARVRVSGTEMKSNGAPCVQVEESGNVVVTGCSIVSPMKSHTPPAVRLNGGHTVLSANSIVSTATGVEIGPDVGYALVTSNMIEADMAPIVIAPDTPSENYLIESNGIVKKEKED